MLKSDVSRSITILTVLGQWKSAEVGGIVTNTPVVFFFLSSFCSPLPNSAHSSSHFYTSLKNNQEYPTFLAIGFPTSSGDFRVPYFSGKDEVFYFHTLETRVYNLNRGKLG